MDVATGFLTGFLFDLARDVFKTVLQKKIEKKIDKIDEEQIRKALLERVERLETQLQKQNESQSQQIHIHFEVGTIDVLVREVYAIASSSPSAQVKGNIIQIRPSITTNVSPTILERQFSQQVRSIKAEIGRLAQEDFGDIERQPKREQVEQEEERALIFGDTNRSATIEMASRDINDIASDFKKRIQSVIRDEESSS